jgi:putative transposase
MAKDKFNGDVLKANTERKRLGLPLLEPPEGATTLIKKIKAERTPENVKRKTSKREADAEFNGTNPALESQIPFEYVALDFTRLDVFVVDDESEMLLGRPILGTGIEVSSRAIAGFLLTFEDPSISTILTLIKKCILPKYYVEEMLPDVVDRIDTFGKPHNIIIDRGLENLTDGLRHSCDQIGIDIRWAPRKTGQGKTWVERLFGTLNTTTFHPLPGSVPHHPALMRRLDLDPTKTAVIKMSSLIELLHRNWINYENRTHSGVDEAPAPRLRRFIKIHKRPMLADISMIDTLIANTARGTLGTDGIHFKGMHFQNRNATTEIRSIMVAEQGKTKKNSKANVKVQIKYNPDDASIIHVPFKKDGRWIYAKFFNRMDRFSSGLSFSLEARIRRFSKDKNLAYENEEHRIQARAAYVELVELLSQLKGAAGREVEKKILAQLPRLKGELYHDYPEANLDDQDVKFVEPPFAESSLTDVRGRGIQRGKAKAVATAKHNKKVRQKIAQLDAKTSPEQGVRTDTFQAPLGISFGSRNSAK